MGPAGAGAADPQTVTDPWLTTGTQPGYQPPAHTGEVVVDLDAIAGNVAELARRAASRGAMTMAVVKADGYGHGLLPSALAALAGGATWLGTAQVAEALQLRAAGVDAPVLAWLYAPTADLAPAVERHIDLSVASLFSLNQVAAAARSTGRRARIHLKIDTGLGRNGSSVADWPTLIDAAASAQADGLVQVIGIWSHFAWADAPAHPTVALQQQVFEQAVEVAAAAGVRPTLRHLANSAATLTNPDVYYDLVRPGLAVYGLSAVPDLGAPADFGLRPAMSVSCAIALVKRVPAGHGVSYGHEYRTSAPTQLALVPMGYADGIPRCAGGTGPISIDGHRFTVAGRVCMDQVSLDIGDELLAGVDPAHYPRAVLIGDGPGEPTAQDWADAGGTISYEIVTRMAPGIARRYIGTAGTPRLQ
ncbi:MAG: alanine racemase [Micrococcales bacterium]|nr:MAG: alanine racemase [Micrococcales bacterium]PIE27350.1 MAG: alanine racemase [Micrococcales bacterium]